MELNKLLVAVEQHSYAAPTKASVRDYLTNEWLPALKSTIRPSTYNSYVQHVECHIAPHIGSVNLQKLRGSQVNALYAKLAESGKKNGKKGVPAAVTVAGQLTDTAMLPLPPGRESEPCLTEKGSTWTLDACSFAW